MMLVTQAYDQDIDQIVVINDATWGDGKADKTRFWCNQNFFPEGQFVLRSGRGIEAYCSSLILNIDGDYQLTNSWDELTDSGNFFRHSELGKWLYVAELDFRDGIERENHADLFYFRLRMLAKQYDLKGIIQYVAAGEDRDENRFLRLIDSIYQAGFKTHSVVQNFRVRFDEMMTGIHFSWGWND